jgi:hypothetical protein
MYTTALANSPFIVGSGWNIVVIIELGVAKFDFANFDKIVIPTEGLVLLNSRNEFGARNKEENASDYKYVRKCVPSNCGLIDKKSKK